MWYRYYFRRMKKIYPVLEAFIHCFIIDGRLGRHAASLLTYIYCSRIRETETDNPDIPNHPIQPKKWFILLLSNWWSKDHEQQPFLNGWWQSVSLTRWKTNSLIVHKRNIQWSQHEALLTYFYGSAGKLLEKRKVTLQKLKRDWEKRYPTSETHEHLYQELVIFSK